MAISKVTGGGILDNSVTDADINSSKLNGVASSANNYTHPNHSGDVVSTADGATVIQTDAVDIAMLSATGSPGSTTFLRGDNSWATAGSTSASDLTSGTIPAARIGDDVITADKLANSINSAIAANTSKTGITSSQATAITAALPKAGGTMTGDLILPDNVALEIGSGTNGDLQIHHDGTHTYIDNKAGELIVTSDYLHLKGNSAAETTGKFIKDGAVELYHNNAKKIETTATGVTVTGDLASDNFQVKATAPGSPSQGDIWFNSSASTVSSIASKSLAVYSGTAWNGLKTDFSATGGTITTSGLYTIHTFTSSGTFTPNKPHTVDYLVVAGGGGSGGYGGGGGAGGFRTATGFAVAATGLTVTVGAGGSGSDYNGLVASNGGNSVFSSITSLGGGGGSSRNHTGANGGSGGGGNGGYGTAGGSGTSGQGNNGGTAAGNQAYHGAGGGGASQTGGNGTTSCGNGGAGTASSYSGSSVTYAGGGGGATDTSDNGGAGGAGGGGKGKGGDGAATAGSANTGGGGGAGSNVTTGSTAGGSGIVIIRYLT